MAAARAGSRGGALDLLLRDVLGHFQVAGPRFLRLGHLERLAYHLRNHHGRVDAGIPFRDGPQEIHDIDVLVGLLVDPVAARLAGDGHQRRPIEIGIGDPRGEIRRSGAQGRQTDTGMAREPAVGIRHERRPLFVAGGDKPDLGVEERLHDVQDFLPRYPEDVLHAFILKTANQQVRCFHRRTSSQDRKSASPARGRQPPPGAGFCALAVSAEYATAAHMFAVCQTGLTRVSRHALSSRASTSCSTADSRITTSPGPSVRVRPAARKRTDPDRTCRVIGPAA